MRLLMSSFFIMKRWWWFRGTQNRVWIRFMFRQRGWLEWCWPQFLQSLNIFLVHVYICSQECVGGSGLRLQFLLHLHMLAAWKRCCQRILRSRWENSAPLALVIWRASLPLGLPFAVVGTYIYIWVLLYFHSCIYSRYFIVAWKYSTNKRRLRLLPWCTPIS